MAPTAATQNDILIRIKGEYNEMPGLRLTVPQVQRLWGIDRLTCDKALDSLVQSRFLHRTKEGHYIKTRAA
jgi:Fic family protein